MLESIIAQLIEASNIGSNVPDPEMSCVVCKFVKIKLNLSICRGGNSASNMI